MWLCLGTTDFCPQDVLKVKVEIEDSPQGLFSRFLRISTVLVLSAPHMAYLLTF